MDVKELHKQAVGRWLDTVAGIGYDQWDRTTPCAGWDVRTLVNHVTYEERWTVPLVQGQTLEQVGDQFEGDLLGDDEAAAASAAGSDAVLAVGQATVDSVQLSYGQERLEEYVHQLAADHLVHGWDLAVATGQDYEPHPDVVADVARWFADHEDSYRSSGAVAARPESAAARTPFDRLLVAFGRDPAWSADGAALAAFSAAFGAGDVEGIMRLVTDDVVFESTGPAPDGQRVEGADAVREVFADLFGSTPGARFTEEESFATGDRAVLRWRYEWGGDQPGHVRGVDVIRLRDGKVAEKLSYVKG